MRHTGEDWLDTVEEDSEGQENAKLINFSKNNVTRGEDKTKFVVKDHNQTTKHKTNY